ncbi:hypothetical protein BV25DRAFT_1917035 [Artomyces pyxidatus]|uniref:Uncharacterized protein n=1 Tax=Artomyces pyxidatus TaxID=48021 RepID=A0ACB8SXR2_9AGAM|nr:hypothetical protein BV25DRAFT_1917035 [Artomyces pyxidatus]
MGLSLQGLVLTSQNTRGHQPDRKLHHQPLDSDHTLSAQDILREWKSHGDLDVAYFSVFVTRHAYPKIAGRLLNLRLGKLWTEHPIAVLERFSQETPNPTVPFPWTISLTTMLSVADTPIPQKTAGGTYAYIFALRRGSYSTPTRLIWWTILLLTMLRWLQDFLKSNLINHLVTDKSLATKLSSASSQETLAYDHPLSTLSSPVTIADGHALSAALAAAINDGDSGDIELDDNSEDESSVDPDDFRSQGADGGHYFIRHMKTIVAPVSAILSLTRRSALPYRLKAQLVTVPDPVINEDRVNALKQEFIDTVLALVSAGHEQQARSFLRKKLKTPAITGKPTVHAEAGMMALACAFYSNDRASASMSELGIGQDFANVLTDVFSAREAAVGVSETCCWCCWKLHLWLQRHKADLSKPPTAGLHTDAGGSGSGATAAQHAKFPELMFLGSYAAVSPWYPPQFGVPIEFLRELLEDLKAALATAAVLRSEAASPHTSTRSSGESDHPHGGLRNAIVDVI